MIDASPDDAVRPRSSLGYRPSVPKTVLPPSQTSPPAPNGAKTAFELDFRRTTRRGSSAWPAAGRRLAIATRSPAPLQPDHSMGPVMNRGRV
jgi:hypothetical protein